MSQPKNRPWLQRFYFLLFAFSGFAGLIYESIWSHYLKLFLGHAAYAQTLVLVIFMGGMTLGAWLIGRYSARIRKPLLAYAAIEAVLGILAILFHGVFERVTGFIFSSVIPNLDAVAMIEGIKWTTGGLIILPQSILLGATFPLMSAGLVRKFPELPGKSLSLLYFTNSLGAAVGILASGFFFINYAGLPGTVLIAAFINCGLAAVIWLLERTSSTQCPPPDENAPHGKSSPHPSSRQRGLAPLLLAASALTGCASFLYEIGWVRMLSLVLGSSTHSFELMLSAFIFGLALGSFILRRRIDGLAAPLATLAFIQIVMALLALATIGVYNHSFNWMAFCLRGLAPTDQGYTLYNLFSHGVCIVMMAPVTICAGMTLPLITTVLLGRGYGEKSIGHVYAANTIGSIIGVLVGVHVVMPQFGLKSVIVAGGLVDLSLGAVLLIFARGRRNVRDRAILGGATALALVLIFVCQLDPYHLASGVYRLGVIRRDRDIMFHKDGKTASVSVTRDQNGHTTLLTNGKPDASLRADGKLSLDDPTMVLLGLLPWLVHPESKTAAVIGMGSGRTTHALLTVPQMGDVDTIEIEPAMLEGARLFKEQVALGFTDPRSHIHIEDARTFFSRHRKTYDIIVSEPSNPWVSGVATLFSKEFYNRVQSSLADDGLFIQWIQTYEFNMDLLASVIKAVSVSFADYAIYTSNGWDLLVVASKTSKIPDPDVKAFTTPGVRELLAHVEIHGRADLEIRRLGNRESLEPFFDLYAVPANSDYYPYLDLHAVKARFQKQTTEEFTHIQDLGYPLMDAFATAAPRPRDYDHADSETFRPSRAAYRARRIHQWFLRRAGKADALEPSPGSRDTDAILVARLLSIPDGPDADTLHETWVDQFVGLMRQTLPHLGKQGADDIATAIESLPAWQRTPETTKHWLALYRALGARDYKRVDSVADKLMNEDNGNPDRLKYVCRISMCANLALNQPKKSLSLYNNLIDPASSPVDLRMMAAYAYKLLKDQS